MKFKHTLVLTLFSALTISIQAQDAAWSAAQIKQQELKEQSANGAPATDQTVDKTVDKTDDLAMKLANPLAAMISVPFQGNYDQNLGFDGNGERWRINVQPVMPFSLNDDWNIISRTIVPIISQSNFTNSDMNESGLGDILQSVWASPVELSPKGWVWGVGGAFLFPTATHDVLGGGKWGAGPTAVALKQMGPWTVGGLTNHLWSYAGDNDRNYVNTTFVQPFCSYVTPTKTTLSVNTESSYNWATNSWEVPINLQVSQMVALGKQPLQLQVGARYWAGSSNAEQEGTWGLRLAVTMLFPK